MRITPLGAGQEVGRSCILLEFKNKTVMVRNTLDVSIVLIPTLYFLQLDCGLHPGRSGLDALPFFDNIDPATIDILLLTQFSGLLFELNSANLGFHS
jgi:cleavage and polyadenylation specificity factor subunit 3